MDTKAPLKIGIPIHPRFALIDVMGPLQVFGMLSDPPAQVLLIARTLDAVTAAPRTRVLPDVTFADCPQLDVLVVPGGAQGSSAAEDKGYLELIRQKAATAKYVMSISTGTLVLAAAGLLDEKLVTTHWAALGAIRDRAPKATVAGGYPRYVIDGKLICTGGLSAGIDGALALVAMLRGAEEARAVQLALQYAPVPPFSSGDPSQAEPQTVARAYRILAQLGGAAPSSREGA